MIWDRDFSCFAYELDGDTCVQPPKLVAEDVAATDGSRVSMAVSSRRCFIDIVHYIGLI